MDSPPQKRTKADVSSPATNTAVVAAIETGASVTFWGTRRGIVKDAYAPLDEFWVADEGTGQLVRNESGEIVAFKASELAVQQPTNEGISARVLLLGKDVQMMKILEHFGSPECDIRKDVQQLLAIPCGMCKCSPSCSRFDPLRDDLCDPLTCQLAKLGNEGVDEVLVELAKTLRPDIEANVRPYHMKQAAEQIGPDLGKMADYYCLASVTMPYGSEDIKVCSGWERRRRSEIRCHVDLGVTVDAMPDPKDDSPEDTAKRALGDIAGIFLGKRIWGEEMQTELRKKIGVDIPHKFWDGPNARVFVIIIPDEVEPTVDGEALYFESTAPLPVKSPARSTASAAASGTAVEGGKNAGEWRDEQSQFAHLPQPPKGWIRVKSRSDGVVYFFHPSTKKSQFDMPLPAGWSKQVSKSSGKSYFFNAAKRKSMFDMPTDAD